MRAQIPAVVRHAAGLLVVVIVFLGYRHSGTVIDDGGLFLLLSIAVLFNAWFAGTSTALGATVLGAVLGYLPGRQSHVPAVETHLALFIGQGVLLTALVAELRRARKAAEREAVSAHAARLDAEAASRLKDEFLGTISHELRTPLNAVLGWVHLIRTGKLDSATERRGFEAIERNARLQAQLTGDLLDVSKSLTGRLHLETAPVSLTKIVAEAVSQVRPAATAKQVTLNVSAPDRPLVVRADANRLRQAVWHLLANGIKFTPSGGTVDVTLESNESACVTVRDSGTGIDPAFLPRIFDRFTQADSSVTRTSGGLGVGLSLVRELVERHGGDIRAMNRSDGQHGAMFVIHLPIRREDQREIPVPPPPTASDVAGAPLDGVRVLLLDRDRDARELLSVVLEQRGASVCVAASVDQALEMLESWRPDVLVSDTTSPEHDAYALVGKVQSLESDRGGRIPALALTTFASKDERMRRMLSGVKRDLPKPVEPAVLAAEIARLTGRERRRASRT
jgi:signal transduction histidine kinase/ActR/RegA family two-component response regulator